MRLRERGALLRPEDVLLDPEGRGFEMRFGGHREIGRGPHRFCARPGVLPEDGSRVTIVLRDRRP